MIRAIKGTSGVREYTGEGPNTDGERSKLDKYFLKDSNPKLGLKASLSFLEKRVEFYRSYQAKTEWYFLPSFSQCWGLDLGPCTC